jgi:hypothetical protein
MSTAAASLIAKACKYKSKNPSWFDKKYYDLFVE